MADHDIQESRSADPRFFYGYTVVAASFFTIMVSFGLYGTFGIFFNPLITEFGWTRATISGAYSLSMALHGILAIIMGGLSDRFGPRLVVTFCGIFLGLGYILMSQVHTVWQLYLYSGVIIGIGMSGVWIPLLSTIARWFVRRRTLMSAIAIAGGGIGSFIVPPVVTRLIDAYEWRQAYIMVGIAVFAIMIIAAQFLKRDPVKTGQAPYGEGENQAKLKVMKPDEKALSLKEAVYTTQFWLTSVILFCFGFCMVSVMVHIVPHAIDLGIPATSAANILAIRGGIGILGTYLLGGLGDRIGNRKIFIIGFTVILASLLWLIPAGEAWMLFLFAGVYGFVLGGMGASESPLVAGLFGLKSHGLIYGVIGLGFTLGASIGPIMTGYIFDSVGSYQIAFWISAALGVAGIAIATILKPIRR